MFLFTKKCVYFFKYNECDAKIMMLNVLKIKFEMKIMYELKSYYITENV